MMETEVKQKTDPGKLRRIWSHKRGKHIGERDFRAIIREVTGQVSSKHLSEKDADEVIRRLEKEKPRKPTGRPRHRQPKTVSARQLTSIRQTAAVMGMTAGKIDAMVRRMFKSEEAVPLNAKSLTPSEAVKLHEALKAMKARGFKATRNDNTIDSP